MVWINHKKAINLYWLSEKDVPILKKYWEMNKELKDLHEQQDNAMKDGDKELAWQLQQEANELHKACRKFMVEHSEVILGRV